MEVDVFTHRQKKKVYSSIAVWQSCNANAPVKWKCAVSPGARGFSIPKAGQPTAAPRERPLAVSFLPVSPTGNTRAEKRLLNTQGTAGTSKLVPTDPKKCQGPFLPSAVLHNVRKRWDRKKVCQEVCTCTAHSSMLLFTVAPRCAPVLWHYFWTK